jgi:hypothetical protein
MTSFSLLLTAILTLLIKILALLQNFNISYRNIDITHRNIDITHKNNDCNFIFTVGVIFALLTEEIIQVINIYWLFYLYLVTPLIFLPCPNQTSRNLLCFLKFDIRRYCFVGVQHRTFQVTKIEFKIIIGRYCFVNNILIYITNLTHRIIMVQFFSHFKEL